MTDTITITVTQEDITSDTRPRLDSFLARQPDLPTRSQLKSLIQNGNIRLNDQKAKASSQLNPGDIIRIDLPEPEPSEILPEDLPLTVLYEDQHLIVIDKAAGMIVHPTAYLKTGTLVNALLHHCKDLSGIGGELKPGIVHRLDKLTSGVMIAAKNDQAHLGLAEQFRDHSITRRYLALVHGTMTQDSGTIKSLIARHPVQRKKMSGKVTRGKTAITHYKVISHYDFFTLVECKLETGRTHQIRVHLSENHHPVVGDLQYGKNRGLPAKLTPTQRSAIRQLKRQALHAYILGFNHPVLDQYMEFRSDLPIDFKAVLSSLEKNKNDSGD